MRLLLLGSTISDSWPMPGLRGTCARVSLGFSRGFREAPETWCGGAESRGMSHTMPDGETSIKELISPPQSCLVLPSALTAHDSARKWSV